MTNTPDPANSRRGDTARVLTVADLIRVLTNYYPPELPVYLADWNEEYAEDWPLAADEIRVLDEKSIHDKLGALLYKQPRRLCLGSKEPR